MRPADRLARGAVVELRLPERAPEPPPTPLYLPLEVVFEDEHLAVVDKPGGLVVHPAPGHRGDTLLEVLVARGMRLSGGPAERLGIVHRLDRDTSGLLVVAKSALAHRQLSAAVASRRLERRYAVLAWGHLGPGERRIAAAIARDPRDRKRMAVVRESAGGRPAATRALAIARGRSADLLRVHLESGRTHQIRVHLHSIGHPVVGDPVYGGGGSRRVSGGGRGGGGDRAGAAALERVAPRQALHAAWLRFPHPVSGEALDLVSEWPADLLPALSLAMDDPALLAAARPLAYLGFFG